MEPYLDRRVFSYSTGIKRRLDIARGLLHQPDILLLDEPTTNLDPISAVELRDFLIQIRDQGTTIIMVTHRLEEVARRSAGAWASCCRAVFRKSASLPGRTWKTCTRAVGEGGLGAVVKLRPSLSGTSWRI